MQKFDNPEMERKTADSMRKEGQPVSIDWLAHNLGVGWGTARAILMNMSMQGKLKAIRTTKGFVFALKERDQFSKKIGEPHLLEKRVQTLEEKPGEEPCQASTPQAS